MKERNNGWRTEHAKELGKLAKHIGSGKRAQIKHKGSLSIQID